MRLSLTTTGLLDPRQLAAWSTERRRAIHTAVAKAVPGADQAGDGSVPAEFVSERSVGASRWAAP